MYSLNRHNAVLMGPALSPGNCLKTRTPPSGSPTSRMHPVLGNLVPTKTLVGKECGCPHARFSHTTQASAIDKRHNLAEGNLDQRIFMFGCYCPAEKIDIPIFIPMEIIIAAINVKIKIPTKDSTSKLPERKPRDLNAYKGNVIGQAKNMYMA